MGIRHYLNRFRGWLSSSTASAPPRPAQGNKARLGLEGLEDRLIPASNLLAAGLAAPPLVVPGQTASIRFTVVNNGNVATPASVWRDTVVLSADNRFDATDVVLGSLTHVGRLAPGGRYTQTLNATIPPSVPAGMTNVLVLADTANAARDVRRADNVRVVSVAAVNAHAALLAGRLGGVLGAPLAPAGVTVHDGVPSVTLQGMPGKQYRVAGFLVTDIRLAVTGSDPAAVSGTAKVRLPLGSGAVAVPVAVTLDGDVLSVRSEVTLQNFRLGAESAQMAAPSVRVRVGLDVNLATKAVSGSVAVSAASAVLLPESGAGQVPAGRILLADVQGTLTSTGAFTATAAAVRLQVPRTLEVKAASVTLTVDPARPTAPLAVLASATVTSPRFPGLTATLTNTVITRTGFAIASLDLAAPSATLDATAEAANVRMSVRNLLYRRGIGFTATLFRATASSVTLLGGRAKVEGVTFTFNLQSGAMTGTVAKLDGKIGSVVVTATGGTLAAGAGATGPLLRVASARFTVPGAANLTVTNFGLQRDGRFSFGALAGLAMPAMTTSGPVVTGSFRGDVRVSGTTAVIHLIGAGRVFGKTAVLEGDLEAGDAGLVGGLRLKAPTSNLLPGFGTGFGFTGRGEGYFLVNRTAEARSVTVAGLTRTVAANSGRMVINGSINVRGFNLAGTFDLVPSGNNLRVTGNAVLNLNRFGVYAITPTGSFTITSAGVVGSLLLVKREASNEFFTMHGDATLRLNTTTQASAGIAANVAELRLGGGITPKGLEGVFQASGAVSIGFKDNAGVANDFFFVKIPASRPVQATLFDTVTVGFSGELRSNGFADLTGSARVQAEIPLVVKADARLAIRMRRDTAGVEQFDAAGGAVVTVGPVTGAGSARLTADGVLAVLFNGLRFEIRL